MSEKNTEEKKKKFSLRKLIYNDKYLIIFSIVAAIVVWVATSMNLSPETTKTITVPVNVDFSNSAASQLGIKCYGDETFDVDVTVTCKKYLARDITAEDLNVTLQTNTVTTKGNIEVPIKVDADDNAEFTIKSYYPTVYKGYFDVEDKKVMDINISYDNTDFIADGYIMGEPLLSETTATVVGPKTYVAQVKQLIANVNIDEKLSSTQSIALTVNAVDSSGDIVDYVDVDTGSENFNLTIPVLKRMKLNVTSSFSNVPSDVDTSDFEITYSKDVVNTAVLEEADIKEANIGNIDFSDLNVGDNSFTFDVSTLESMVIVDDIKEITVNVNVPSSYSSTNVSVDKSMVTITNIPDGYDATVTSISSNTVNVISQNDESEDVNVGLIVDLSAYKNNIATGSDDYNITTSVENSSTCWVYGKYTAKISIVKK